jgi:mRNA interferase MazF
MKPGDIVLARLQQSDGALKLRPVMLLKQMPGYGDWLITGISTQLHQEIKGFDIVLSGTHPDFAGSKLKAPSLVRLSFLTVLPSSDIKGAIGKVSEATLRILLNNLVNHLNT